MTVVLNTGELYLLAPLRFLQALVPLFYTFIDAITFLFQTQARRLLPQ